MIFNLERRGYVHAGHFTPEVVIEHPDAGNNFFLKVIYYIKALCFFAWHVIDVEDLSSRIV